MKIWALFILKSRTIMEHIATEQSDQHLLTLQQSSENLWKVCSLWCWSIVRSLYGQLKLAQCAWPRQLLCRWIDEIRDFLPTNRTGYPSVCCLASQLTQNICITLAQCWNNVEDIGPTCKCTNVLCLLGECRLINPYNAEIFLKRLYSPFRCQL